MYQFIEYLKYRWRAKNRHGVHSPFVYAFNDVVLNCSSSETALLENMVRYFNIKHLMGANMDGSALAETMEHPAISAADYSLSFNRLYTARLGPGDNYLFFKDLDNDITTDDIVVIKPLHESEHCNMMWQKAKQHHKVTMSIDLFDLGLLFFKREFKEKQHFVLKWRRAHTNTK